MGKDEGISILYNITTEYTWSSNPQGALDLIPEITAWTQEHSHAKKRDVVHKQDLLYGAELI